ncbi:LytTR family transcriptional regulator [Fructilactobacillus myrtifloralis]|uniref:LytTR family transcriptional regulator n=1 Tax=Fructilactobacillus myrtifloralis TaxID=2940301 RepID=A0ABY5BS86_9LACO|nr:LytTR family DNA-binding domain-containing protein [Fructilactobacillus myrtifloralis]USS85113.1 LytTR family transcriptional regulator [Fructilactobacillus myrtifloralis]
MKVEFDLQSQFAHPFATLHAKRRDAELVKLATELEQWGKPRVLTGYQHQQAFAIPIADIRRIYTEAKAVYAETQTGKYRLQQRIYQLRAILPGHQFIQISSAEIVNVALIARLSLSRTGQYEVRLKTGQVSYASRRFVQKMKKELD